MILNPGRPDVAEDEEMKEALVSLFRANKSKRDNNKIRTIIESGTYHGTGTTKIWIGALEEVYESITGEMEAITFEADYNNFKIAKKNLEKYTKQGWLKISHAITIPVDEAVDFIENDEMLKYSDKYPDLYYDAYDPVSFYRQEVMGRLPVFGGNRTPRDNAIEKYIFFGNEPESNKRSRKYNCPLFFLDSCGGIGWYEYNKIKAMMGERRYYVWIHDINHVKHYRTYIDITDIDKKNWVTIHEKKGEWLLARTKYMNKKTQNRRAIGDKRKKVPGDLVEPID